MSLRLLSIMLLTVFLAKRVKENIWVTVVIGEVIKF